MFVSSSHKFVFFHVPKTGGSSITAALAGTSDVTGRGWQARFHVNGMHSVYEEVRGTLRADYPKHLVFAFFRNPWSRALSLYKHAHDDGESLVEYFERWKNGTCRGRNNRDLNCDPQVSFIVPDACDFVGRFERLEEDFVRLCGQLDIKCELGHLNRNRTDPTDHVNWRSAYTSQDQVDIVAECFADDVRLLGYEF